MNILFLGGDERMSYAADYLSRFHEIVYTLSSDYSAVVLPFPLSKDGEHIFCSDIALADIQSIAQNKLVLAGGNLPFAVNYAKDEALITRNASLTSEGAVVLLSNSTKSSLMGSNALITGFGRIGGSLAKRLLAMECAVSVAVRNPEQRKKAAQLGCTVFNTDELSKIVGTYDFIINTAPAPLFSDVDFQQMHGVFLELASLPPRSAPLGERYIHGGGLPGKMFPQRAGEFIAETLLSLISK